CQCRSRRRSGMIMSSERPRASASVKPQYRIRAPVADPPCIGLIDIDGIGLRPVAGQVPASPALGLAIVAEEIAAVPAGNPERAAAIAPDAPGALARHGRLQDRDGVGLGI